MSNKLERYKLGSSRHYSESFSDQHYDEPTMKPDKQGEWVKYEDAVRLLKRKAHP